MSKFVRFNRLMEVARERILILDGAMGTEIQNQGLAEENYRGTRFANHPSELKGNHDLLCITSPEAVEKVHNDYLTAGADIIETNSFNSTAICMEDYGLAQLVPELNREAASVARRCADAFTAKNPDKPRFVAGILGPTNKSCSLSPDVNDPGARAINFDTLVRDYQEASEALLEGGADFLLIETVFDTLNAKAAIFAIENISEKLGEIVPVMISCTIPDASGRTLSGQMVEAFLNSVSHCRGMFSMGSNCALGAKELRPHVKELAGISPYLLNVHPNAGLPNAFGGYDQTPAEMAMQLKEWATSGLINIIGGCCGTTPEHITAISEAMVGIAPRIPATRKPVLRLSGLEALSITKESNFINVGERTNVAGSRIFLKKIEKEDYEGALKIARKQVNNGASIIDINMDDGMLDGVVCMERFLNLLAAEPDICRVPIMIDSSRFEVIEAGLKCIQGKSVVNSLSLKDGEEKFLERAKIVRKYGAAVLVMAFDEAGQADNLTRRVEILSRAWTILTEKANFPPEDILFDPNVFAIATGIPEHNDYAREFIEAVRELKGKFPLSAISGGISNVSFSFRGNDRIRESIHAVFLYHARQAGLDMGIVNAGQLMVYDSIPADVLPIIEAAVLNTTPDATDQLLELAETFKGKVKQEEEDQSWRQLSVEDRLVHALVQGIIDHAETDAEEARIATGDPLLIIEKWLMRGMGIVGKLFGEGKMFLPQVVKSARVMKKAVAVLEPWLNSGEGEEKKDAATIVMATVRGDVHDIGKNIVSVVMQCNNYKVIDLGVMCPAEKIVDAVITEKADVLGLSGLITPSLDEMVEVARELKRRNITIPLLIGGATTSALHTAAKVAPEMPGVVVHVKDASMSIPVLSNLLSDVHREDYIKQVQAEQLALRKQHKKSGFPIIPLSEARAAKVDVTQFRFLPKAPNLPGIQEFRPALSELKELIDWRFFLLAWEFRGRMDEILADPNKGKEAQKLLNDGKAMLEKLLRENALSPLGVYGILPAASQGDDIFIYTDETRQQKKATLYTLRQQLKNTIRPEKPALADFIHKVDSGIKDWVGLFAVTAGHELKELSTKYREDNDDYNALLLETLGDRIAEAMAEYLHLKVRKEFWGYDAEENLTSEEMFKERYQGIRPAPGYPACPDHTEKRTIWSLLEVEERIGITLTESCAMNPVASVSGYYFAHPEAKYFAIHRIDDEQMEEYLARKGGDVEDVRRHLDRLK